MITGERPAGGRPFSCAGVQPIISNCLETVGEFVKEQDKDGTIGSHEEHDE